LLKEPFRKLPTAADRNAADRAEWEREQDAFWAKTYIDHVGPGCALMIAVSLLALAGLVLDPDPWSTLLALVPATKQRG
jgi:hypothetical protein